MYAFYGCTNLTEVNLGGSMTTLRDNAFEECTALKTVVLPDSLTYIGSYAFHNCKALESVSVPGSVDILPSSVFAGCSALQTATLGEGITSIGAYTFEKCSALTSIFLPSTLTQIANQAFYSCSSLKTVAYAGSREQWRAISIDAMHNDPLFAANVIYTGGFAYGTCGDNLYWDLSKDGLLTIYGKGEMTNYTQKAPAP